MTFKVVMWKKNQRPHSNVWGDNSCAWYLLSIGKEELNVHEITPSNQFQSIWHTFFMLMYLLSLHRFEFLYESEFFFNRNYIFFLSFNSFSSFDTKDIKRSTCNDFYWSFRKSFFYRAGKIHESSKVRVWKCWRSSSVEVVLAGSCFVIRISHCND